MAPVPRVSIEEIRRIRDEHGKRTGAARLDRAAIEALRAGASPEQVARITAKWYLKEIRLEEAVRMLRELAGRAKGNGRRAR